MDLMTTAVTLADLPFGEAITEFLKAIVNGTIEIVALLKTLTEAFVYFVKWVPQVMGFCTTQLTTFIPTPLASVFFVAVVIFFLKLMLGGDS